MQIRKWFFLIIPITFFGCAALNNSVNRMFQTPLNSSFGNHYKAIESLLGEGEKVSLAIVMESINNPSVLNQISKESFESWAKGAEDQLITEYAQAFLKRFGDEINFQLIDRNKLDKIIEEYVFQYQGLTRQIDAEKLGQFANATHLMIVTFTRNIDKGAFSLNQTDLIQGRLVNVKEAKILSVNQYANRRAI